MAGRKRKYTEDQIDRAVTLREDGRTLQQIEQETGVHRCVVSHYCLRLGADLPAGMRGASPNPQRPPYRRGRHIVRPFSPEDDARILEMANQGLTRAEIARAMGRKRNSIEGRLLTLARHDARAEDESRDQHPEPETPDA